MKSSFKSNLFLVFVLLLLLIGFQIATYYSTHLFREINPATPAQTKELTGLASMALNHADAPISSIIVYNGEIIGRGYNTVIRDTNAGAHAEINAISDALKRYSRKEFAQLSRDSLFLISTYEPCLMCRGAILEYNIKQVQFMKAKSLWHLFKEDARTYIYEWKRKHTGQDELQDSLFMLHPGYQK